MERERAKTEEDLAAIDTRGFGELQNKRAVLPARIGETEETLQRCRKDEGKTGEPCSGNASGGGPFRLTAELLLRDFETSPPDELEQRELVRIRRPPWSIPH